MDGTARARARGGEDARGARRWEFGFRVDQSATCIACIACIHSFIHSFIGLDWIRGGKGR